MAGGRLKPSRSLQQNLWVTSTWNSTCFPLGKLRSQWRERVSSKTSLYTIVLQCAVSSLSLENSPSGLNASLRDAQVLIIASAAFKMENQSVVTWKHRNEGRDKATDLFVTDCSAVPLLCLARSFRLHLRMWPLWGHYLAGQYHLVLLPELIINSFSSRIKF